MPGDRRRPSPREATTRRGVSERPRSSYPERGLPRSTGARREARPREGSHLSRPAPIVSEEQPQELWTAANIVTFVRVGATLVWMLFAVICGPGGGSDFSWPCFLLAVFFAVIAFTDTLDGYLARSRDEVTDVGKFMDPIADKLICLAGILVLFGWGYLSIWVPMIIVAREFLVSGLRMVVASKGEVVAASIIGKWKTGFTMGAIIGYFVALSLPAGAFGTVLLAASWLAMVVAVVLTLWSGVDYLMKCRGYLS